MMQTSHFSSGTLVGRFMPNPVLAFVAGIVTHLLIDKVPHYWPKTGKGKALFTIIDYVIATIMIILVFAFLKGNVTNMLWGFAGSAIVDILLVGVIPIHKTKLGQWHTNRQPHHTEIGYLSTDIVFTLVCLTLIFI